MSITKAALTRAVARLRLTRYFPGGDPDLLLALGAELNEMCRNDGELAEVVARVVSGPGGAEWQGVGQLHAVLGQIREEQAKKDRDTRIIAIRDEHEAGCDGILVVVNEQRRHVGVDRCRNDFNREHEAEGMQWDYSELAESRKIHCRKGYGVTEAQLDERRRAEVATRGWTVAA